MSRIPEHGCCCCSLVTWQNLENENSARGQDFGRLGGEYVNVKMPLISLAARLHSYKLRRRGRRKKDRIGTSREWVQRSLARQSSCSGHSHRELDPLSHLQQHRYAMLHSLPRISGYTERDYRVHFFPAMTLAESIFCETYFCRRTAMM